MKPISQNDLPVFTWQADLQYFEGPLLTHLKDSNDGSYLALWCDRCNSGHRWLIVKTSERQIQQLLEGKCSILDALTSENVYVIDRAGDNIVTGAWIASFDSAREYLPEPDVKILPELIPSSTCSR